MSSLEITDQSQGHVSEGSGSLGKVLSFSVAGSEIPSAVASSSGLWTLEEGRNRDDDVREDFLLCTKG